MKTQAIHQTILQTPTTVATPTRLARQRGFTMIQVAIVLGIVALATVAAVVGGQRYFASQKVQNELSFLSGFKGKVVTYGQQVGTFTAANTAATVLSPLQFFDPAMVGGNAAAPTFTNAWGSLIAVGVGNINQAGDSITYTDPGIGTDACSQLALGADNIGSIITVNGVQTKAAGGVSNPVLVAANCNLAANTIVFTISK